MTDEEFIDGCFRRFLLRPADQEAFDYYLPLMRAGADRLDVVRGIVVSDEFLALLLRQAFGQHVGTPVLAYAPPGHFYSPIPSRDDVERHAEAKFRQGAESLAGIDLNVKRQLGMVRTLGPLTKDLAFAEEPGGETRYYYNNDGFSPGDATVLAALMRYFRPRRIIEAGAGFSTAVMLDVAERYLTSPVRIECVEPDLARLRSLLRPGDAERLTIHNDIVQNVPLEVFASLEANDILFIDSSHVLKLGSDVAFLLLDVLPRLRRGVLVHVHDIAASFEYSPDWYYEGRAFNEAPVMRAFLAFNRAFEITVFCDYLVRCERETIAAHMPGALRQPKSAPGGNASSSLWLRRI